MSNLPEWIEKSCHGCKCHPKGCPNQKALAIAMEALESIEARKHVCEDDCCLIYAHSEANDALIRINNLGGSK